MRGTIHGLLSLLLLVVPEATAQYVCTTNAGSITITKYLGPSGAVSIPAAINGLPVTGIGDGAFEVNLSPYLTSVTIPGSVATIGSDAFDGCTGMTNLVISNG